MQYRLPNQYGEIYYGIKFKNDGSFWNGITPSRQYLMIEIYDIRLISILPPYSKDFWNTLLTTKLMLLYTKCYDTKLYNLATSRDTEQIK